MPAPTYNKSVVVDLNYIKNGGVDRRQLLLERNIAECKAYAVQYKCTFTEAVTDMGDDEAPPAWLLRDLYAYARSL